MTKSLPADEGFTPHHSISVGKRLKKSGIDLKKILDTTSSWNGEGFTLIETLVYVAIFSVVIGGLVAFIQFMSQSRINNQIVLEVNDQGASAVRVMTQALRNAASINSPATGTAGSLLSINTILASTTPTTFGITGNSLYKKEGSSATTTLTNNKVSVNSLQFSNLTRPGAGSTIRLFFTLSDISSSTQASYNYSANFYASGGIK